MTIKLILNGSREELVQLGWDREGDLTCHKSVCQFVVRTNDFYYQDKYKAICAYCAWTITIHPKALLTP